MASRNLIYTVRPALGGLDLTADPTILDPNYLVTADNITYLEGGQRKKRPGLLQYAPTSSYAGTFTNVMLTSGADVTAISDSWDYSTGTLVPVQRLIAVTRNSLFRSTGGGLWTAVTAASSFGISGSQVNIMLGQNHAVISAAAMQPVAYNLNATTIVSPTTGANWPLFESAVFHQTKMVMLGISTAASDIRLTGAGNIFDSTGVDSVTLPIDPGDGDRVIGAAQTFFRNLYIFKGPQFGSVHEISGNTSTAYVKNKITSGAPAASHQGIITTPTDIYWISRFGVHSLATTIKFGDVEQGFLSLPIQDLWRKKRILLTDLVNARGFWDASRNIVGWLVTPANSAQRSWIIVYNYALSDPKPGGKKFWSIWKNAIATPNGMFSVATILNPVAPIAGNVSEPHTYFGGTNGLVYQGGYESFEDDGLPYAAQITTPIITKFNTPSGTIPETSEKQFSGITTYYAVPDSQAISGMTYGATVDNRDAGTGTLTGWQQGGILGTFILGTGLLGGISLIFEESIIEGRGRGIQLTWTNTSLYQDFEHLGYSIRFAPAETDAKEPS